MFCFLEFEEKINKTYSGAQSMEAMELSSKQENNDDDSFIILNSSPGCSLELNGDVQINKNVADVNIDEKEIASAMEDLNAEASLAFKAHCKLSDSPSPASLMVASSIVSEDKSIEQLQQQFGELLDENIILKETVKQNTDSMKQQFLLLVSCQEDMMRTHKVHKEKFEQTKELVEKLRLENKKLKQDLVRLVDSSAQTSKENSTPLEFVSSPDDDTINKLTAQLELVERQRREVIQNNEKMVWQKESLEHMIDSTTKERDELKEKLRLVELDLASKEFDATTKVTELNFKIQMLQGELMRQSVHTASEEDIKKRDETIVELKQKIFGLQNELKSARLSILESENVKLEFSKHKSSVSETMKTYKEHIQELTNRIKEIQSTVFQPVRTSLDTSLRNDCNSLIKNVKLYDQATKHLSELLNGLVNSTSDTLAETMAVISSLYEMKIDANNSEQIKTNLSDMKKNLEKHHTAAVFKMGQVRSTIAVFERIFKDYNELLKKDLTTQENRLPSGDNVQALTTALLARGQELQNLETELRKVKSEKEECEVLKAQLEIYKNDFEAERESRQKMAGEKEMILTDLRAEKRKNEELSKQLEEIRKARTSTSRGAINSISSTSPKKTVTPGKVTSNATNQLEGIGKAKIFTSRGAISSFLSSSSLKKTVTPGKITSNANSQVYKCPKCNRFSSTDYKQMEDHFDFCLDDF